MATIDIIPIQAIVRSQKSSLYIYSKWYDNEEQIKARSIDFSSRLLWDRAAASVDGLGGRGGCGGGIEEGLVDVVGLGLLLGGDERGVWIVIGVEGLVDGLPPFLEAGLAGDLDGDPAQDHRCYGDHGGRDGCHLSLSHYQM